MELYGYFRSSAAYRVRIGLALKQLTAEARAINLRAGEQRTPAFLEQNPQGLVPFLREGDVALGQSLAILEYLEETHPDPPLLPAAPAARGRVRQFAYVIACDLHPLNNLRVIQYLGQELDLDEERRALWTTHWMSEGLQAAEALLAGHPETGRFCHGDTPTLADVCLIPQLYNARRIDFALEPYPTLRRIESECLNLAPFARAAPEAQPDAV